MTSSHGNHQYGYQAVTGRLPYPSEAVTAPQRRYPAAPSTNEPLAAQSHLEAIQGLGNRPCSYQRAPRQGLAEGISVTTRDALRWVSVCQWVISWRAVAGSVIDRESQICYTGSMEKAPISNRDVADLIGLTESGVSRLRTGARRPSVPTMETIQQKLGWDVIEQFKAANYGSDAAWSEAFERKLSVYYDKKRQEEMARHRQNPLGEVNLGPAQGMPTPPDSPYGPGGYFADPGNGPIAL